MTADRKWMEQLGFELEDKGSMIPLWVVVDDCGGERPASLAEIVLWTSLTAPAATIGERVNAIRAAIDTIMGVVDKRREPGWSYRNTITHNRQIIRDQCATIDASLAAPAAPAEPTHLRRADGTLSGMFIEPVASEAAAVSADLRNWLDFLPGHAQPTIEQAVRLLETRP